MELPRFERLPSHVAIIPDGNRRWAVARGLRKEEGYAHGLRAGLALFDIAQALGIPELTFYGFTNDNTRRPVEQTAAFRRACVEAVERIAGRDVAILVVGNDESPVFPDELKGLRERVVLGPAGRPKTKVNFLVNYDWAWDVGCALAAQVSGKGRKPLMAAIGSAEVSRIDLVVRWGGRRRLSGLLPLQAVYADFHTVDAMWPDFEPRHFLDALAWYQHQDPTLGG
ncbi:MAG TPA: undecaprenyl diphosphate synthase family protein [Vulgatibacter sp.]|nr:undecaprenyl diphosphate synthase family protein [Vulgatibacter sp.]